MKQVFVWLAVLLPALISVVRAEGRTGSLVVAQQPRSYTLFVPDAYTPDKPVPLVVLLHGRFGTGTDVAALTGFNDLAEKYGFMALYPDGLDGEWNYVKDVPGYPADAPDDTAFLKALIHHVSDRYTVDSSRIYVAGFSNGGFMAQRLACDAPELFAAFATVAAAGFGGMDGVCPGAGAVRMLLMHGTLDTNIPWNGLGRAVGGKTVPILFSVPDTLAFWSLYNGCGSDVSARVLPGSGETVKTRVHVVTFTACPAGAALRLYAVEGGGHNWPGKPGRIPRAVAGVVSSEIDAGEVVWNFFSRYDSSTP